MSEKTDYLTEDTPIPGQNYVCLSFVSPEKILKQKAEFFNEEFVKWYFKDFANDFGKKNEIKVELPDNYEKNISEKYSDFLYSQSETLQKEFDKKNEFQTNVRGLKVRGIYDSREEANNRAKILHRMDQSHHVFVGNVGQWLPWDPEPDKINDNQYLNEELNTMMSKYQENNVYKDQFFEERKQEALEDQMKKVKENKEKNKKIEEKELEKQEEDQQKLFEQLMAENDIDISELEEKVSETVQGDEEVEDVIKTSIGENEEQTTSDTADQLQEEDPWMQRKKEEAEKKNE